MIKYTHYYNQTKDKMKTLIPYKMKLININNINKIILIH